MMAGEELPRNVRCQSRTWTQLFRVLGLVFLLQFAVPQAAGAFLGPSIGAVKSFKLAAQTGYDTDEEYSRCMTPKQEKDNVLKEGYALVDQRPLWQNAFLKPFKVVKRTVFPSNVVRQPGTLIMVSSGESWYRKNFTFTGWADPDLTPQGVQECQHAARLLLESGYEPDVIFTSRLKRAIHSVWTVLQELNCVYLPVYKTWRLNERMYGALQGLSKKETAERLGADVVQAWRRNYRARPPPVREDDAQYPGNDRRYSDMEEDQIPCSESLQDCMERTRPLWEYRISKELRKGNNVMVMGHTNSLRGLAKIIDDIGDKEIFNLTIPQGIPFVYKFDKDLNPIPPQDGSLGQEHTNGTFLEKPGLLEQAMKRQEEWKKNVPGTELELARVKRMSTMEESLLKLREEQEEFAHVVADNDHSVLNGESPFDDDGEFEEDTTYGSTPSEGVVPNIGSIDVKNDPVVVFIRHGRTPHNQLALFTGWEDPPLAPDGVEDAKNAGRLLKKHGFEFDVVYSSWLTRAIETACYALDELDMQWLPLVKSWRLNERHYGELTGKSKKMVGNIYGEDQLKKWRRGFDIPPPQTSSYSFSYPGNDYRRTKYVKDIRISFRETFFRFLEQGKFQIHRKFPKSESLKMCMARSIPFYTERIVPEAVAKGKRVLITSHENAIRGILMHLCEIPEEHMNELHLPNGLPLIYNVRRKCISLLDDGSGKDPMEVHDFGSAAQYLFRPCELLDEDFLVEEEDVSVTTPAEEEKVTVA